MKIKKLSILAVAAIGVIAFGGSAFAEDENYFADLEKDLVDGVLTVKADDPNNYNMKSEDGYEYNDMIEIIMGVLADKYNLSYASYDWETKDYSKLTFEKQGNCRYETHSYHDYATDSDVEYQNWECDHLGSKTVNVKYTGVDKDKKEKIMKLVEPIVKKQGWKGAFNDVKSYIVDDLSFVNFVAAGLGTDESKIDEDLVRRLHNRMMSFSADYRKDIEGKNIQILVDNRAGDAGPYVSSAIGFAGIVSDGYIYDVIPAAGATVKQVIYIPESTADTHDAYVAAVQKRIDDYYKGTNLEGEIKVSYGGFDDDGGEYGPTDYYYLKMGSTAVDFVAIKDDDRIVEPSFSTGDIDTDIVVSSDDASIPLDTSISVNTIDSSERSDLLKKLGINKAIIFDISLYSDVAKKKIEKLDDGTFKVSIPVGSKYNGKTIIVFHVALDGTVETFNAPVADGYATFVTAHFSEYIVSLPSDDEEIVNPPTSDNIAIYAVLLAGSLIASAGFAIKLRK